MQVRGAHALVTGATGGIGQAVAVALHQAGCRLTLTGRDAPGLAALARRLDARTVTADLLRDADLDALAAFVADGPDLDLAILSAGLGHRQPSTEHDDPVIDRLVATNLTAPVRLTRRLVPLLRRERPGRTPRARLVVIGSIAGSLGVAQESVYAATKAALAIFADSIRGELDAEGIDVGIVVPGVVDTTFFAHRGAPYDRAFPRPISPERVAGAVLRSIRRDLPEVVVPGWMRLPMIVRSLAPQLYRRLATRFG